MAVMANNAFLRPSARCLLSTMRCAALNLITRTLLPLRELETPHGSNLGKIGRRASGLVNTAGMGCLGQTRSPNVITLAVSVSPII
jgi:hypothetical protein